MHQMSVKERVAVATSLGYHATVISKFVSIDDLTKRDRYVPIFGSPRLPRVMRTDVGSPYHRCDIPDVTSLVPTRSDNDTEYDNESIKRSKSSKGWNGSNNGIKPRQYSRITVGLGANLDHVHATLTELKPTLDTYDIVAVAPTTDKAFQYACSNMDVDVISFSRESMQSRLKFQLKHSLMDKARARGVVFEIPYSAMLTDNASKRQHVVSNAHALVQGAGRGKGVVLSSMAETAFQLRGPRDVANMVTFFGMSEEEGLEALSGRVEAVVARRRQGKSHRGELLLDSAISNS